MIAPSPMIPAATAAHLAANVGRQPDEVLSYIVSRGGNLLLLVNLDAQGAIPKVQEERMLSIGKWLEKNGEAIYGTRICAPYSTKAVDYAQSKDGKTVYAIVKEPTANHPLVCLLLMRCPKFICAGELTFCSCRGG